MTVFLFNSHTLSLRCCCSVSVLVVHLFPPLLSIISVFFLPCFLPSFLTPFFHPLCIPYLTLLNHSPLCPSSLILLPGGVDGLEDNVVRKRKCRDGLTSYKERKDAKSKKRAEDTSSASEGDSDKSHSDDELEEGEEGKEQGKGKRSKYSSEVGDADWSEMSVVKITRAMVYLVSTRTHMCHL